MRIKLLPLYPDRKKKYFYLSLMKLSAWHKKQGDKVGFEIKNPDKIYIVTPFRSAAKHFLFNDVEVEYGGYGFNNAQLPYEIEHIKPDYSIYPKIDYSMGFTTRGCIRKRTKPPCIVPECEGLIKENSPIEEFYEPKFKKIRLLDNNILALKDCFFKNTDFIIQHDLTLIADQGFDIRLVNTDIAKRISELNFERHIYFALDSLKSLEQAKGGVRKLEAAGIKPYRLMFYCYEKDNLPDLQLRTKAVIDMGADPFIMPDRAATRTIRRYARYINRRIYKSEPEWKHYKG